MNYGLALHCVVLYEFFLVSAIFVRIKILYGSNHSLSLGDLCAYNNNKQKEQFLIYAIFCSHCSILVRSVYDHADNSSSTELF